MKKLIILSAIGVIILSSAFIQAPEKKVSTEAKSAVVAGEFAFLRAHRQGKGITLTWGMADNTNLAGFDIEKTMEDPNDPYSVWLPVASVPGSGVRSFKHTDDDVNPGTSNYRITAYYSDNRTAQSEIVSVRIMAH
ncbi:MAG: hypothetical protein E6H07_02745 [Bacteroidetes bacterium]|nr:MAG: hypothetical protein E6H07_02745 [Bacteroidota bacterium]